MGVKVIASQKVGRFLRHGVDIIIAIIKY